MKSFYRRALATALATYSYWPLLFAGDTLPIANARPASREGAGKARAAEREVWIARRGRPAARTLGAVARFDRGARPLRATLAHCI